MTIQSSVNQMLSVASNLRKAISNNAAAKAAPAGTTSNAAAAPAGTTSNAAAAPSGTTGKAASSVSAKQEQVRKQRRSFSDYMRDEPVLGRKMKDLDPSLQKKILSHYSTKERKTIMDRKDAEKEAGRK